MLTWKRVKTKVLEPLQTWHLMAGSAVLGMVTDTGPDGVGMRWKATSPDGVAFGAISKAKIAQKLQIHAAQNRGK